MIGPQFLNAGQLIVVWPEFRQGKDVANRNPLSRVAIGDLNSLDNKVGVNKYIWAQILWIYALCKKFHAQEDSFE